MQRSQSVAHCHQNTSDQRLALGSIHHFYRDLYPIHLFQDAHIVFDPFPLLPFLLLDSLPSIPRYTSIKVGFFLVVGFVCLYFGLGSLDSRLALGGFSERDPVELSVYSTSARLNPVHTTKPTIKDQEFKMPSSIASIKVVEAVGKHTGTVIFLHGLGDQGTSFVPLANLLGRSFPNLKFILPSAKEMPITMNSGYTMPAWFDIPRLSDLSNPEASMRDDEPNLLQSLQTIQTLITNEIKEHQIPEQSIVLGGFSQGSVISLLTGIAGERKLGGVVALSGWVPLSHKIAEMAAPHAKDLAVFWGHGTDDQVVGYKFGLKSIELIQSVPQINLPKAPSDKKFQKPGLVFRKYKGMGHALCSEEIDDLTAWLKGITFDVWTSSHRESLAKGQQGTGDVQGHSTIPGSSHEPRL